jgi:hypothetical protein
MLAVMLETDALYDTVFAFSHGGGAVPRANGA